MLATRESEHARQPQIDWQPLNQFFQKNLTVDDLKTNRNLIFIDRYLQTTALGFFDFYDEQIVVEIIMMIFLSK